MLSINMDDVMQVVSNIQNYLIAFGVVLVLALLVMFAVRKMPKAKKKMIRAQSGLAILLALAIVVNLICTGPMSTMLDLVSCKNIRLFFAQLLAVYNILLDDTDGDGD